MKDSSMLFTRLATTLLALALPAHAGPATTADHAVLGGPDGVVGGGHLAMSAPALDSPEVDERAEARNRSVVLAAFDRWRQRQPGFFESILAPEARWTIAGFGEGTRSFDDRASFLAEAVAPFAQRLRTPLVPTVHAAWADGDDVVVHWTGEAVARDGQPYRNRYVWIFTMESERAVAVTAFLDLAAYNDVLRRIP